MVRASFVILVCAALLAGCGEGGLVRSGHYAPEMAVLSKPTAEADAQQFSYSHSWSLLMAHDAVAPRFARIRDLCLGDKVLNCKLAAANLASGSGASSASLEVQLPHDKLAAFERAVLAPLAGESPGDARIVSRSTQAQSVETAASDTARKVTQLTAYRDRLADIAKRPNLSVDDIIKIEAERARVQGELDDATDRQRDLTDGIARESVSIQLEEREISQGPIAQSWGDAADTLAQSTANALHFAVASIPWLPLVAAFVFLVRWLWRLFRRRREKTA